MWVRKDWKVKKKTCLRNVLHKKGLGNNMIWILHCHKAGVQISAYACESSESNYIRQICRMFGWNKISLQVVLAVQSGIFRIKKVGWDKDLNGTLHWACRFIVPSTMTHQRKCITLYNLPNFFQFQAPQHTSTHLTLHMWWGTELLNLVQVPWLKRDNNNLQL